MTAVHKPVVISQNSKPLLQTYWFFYRLNNLRRDVERSAGNLLKDEEAKEFIEVELIGNIRDEIENNQTIESTYFLIMIYKIPIPI